MNESAYLLLGLTIIVGALAGLLAFAVMRIGPAVRGVRRLSDEATTEPAFLTAALEEAMQRLRQEQQASQARAEASEHLSDQIIASLTSGLMVVGIDGTVKTLNPAGRRLLGIGREEEVETKSFRDLLADRAAPLVEVVGQCLDTSQPIVRRKLEMRRTGSHTTGAAHLGVSVSTIVDAGGGLQGANCLFTDLTAVVDLEEQLRLRDSLARLGELTAGLAHEFRNGLATIHGYARLLDPAELPQSYRPYVQSLRAETDALGKVVEKFLAFARPARLTVTDVDLRELAEKVAEELRADIVAQGGDVRVEGEFGVVRGDEILLRQAFSNLVRNAFEACSEAGMRPEIVVEGGVNRIQGQARVSVIDTGPGFKLADRDKMFRPFFTTRAKGTGLGLALVQKIIVTHNGRVSIGQAESGARVQVTRPMAT